MSTPGEKKYARQVQELLSSTYGFALCVVREWTAAGIHWRDGLLALAAALDEQNVDVAQRAQVRAALDSVRGRVTA